MSEFKKSKMLEEFVFDKNIYKIGDKIKVTRRMTGDQSHPFRCYEGVLVSVIKYTPVASDKEEINFILDTDPDYVMSLKFIEKIETISGIGMSVEIDKYDLTSVWNGLDTVCEDVKKLLNKLSSMSGLPDELQQEINNLDISSISNLKHHIGKMLDDIEIKERAEDDC